MSFQQVLCPYCQTPMIDDGSLAGQTVACPACGGQLLMPGVAPPQVQVVQVQPQPVYEPVRRREKGSAASKVGSVIGSILLALAGLMYLVGNALQQASAPAASQMTKAECGRKIIS